MEIIEAFNGVLATLNIEDGRTGKRIDRIQVKLPFNGRTEIETRDAAEAVMEALRECLA